ncbi:MAG: hypothetical protein ACRC6I_12090 [Paracoccaceae bacterium]
MRFLFTILCLLTGGPVVAQTLEEDVRAALIAGDPAQLEALIAAAQTEALASGDHSAIRHVYRRIFATTHPGYEQTIRNWVTTHPDSAFAWAALADMQYWHALAYRASNAYVSHGPKPLGDGFTERLPEARLSALRAHSLDPAFPRATTIALLIHSLGGGALPIDELTTATLKRAPDAEVIVAAARAIQIINNGDFAKGYAACAAYVTYVPGYTADQCAIEIIMTTNSGWDIRQTASQAILTDPSPHLDPMRIEATLDTPIGAEDPQALVALHNAQIIEAADLAAWLRNAERIGYRYNNLFYIDEARQLALAEGHKRIVDDPRNPWLALMLIENQYYEPVLAGLKSEDFSAEALKITQPVWRAALPFGYQSGTFWIAGASAANDIWTAKPEGLVQALPFMENGLVLSGHSDWAVSTIFDLIVGIGYDGWAVIPGTDDSEYVVIDRPGPPEEVRCMAARLARMMEYVCAGGSPFKTKCDSQRPGDEVKDILLKLESPDYCPAVAAMSPSQLPFTELRAVPGFDPATYAGPATAP